MRRVSFSGHVVRTPPECVKRLATGVVASPAVAIQADEDVDETALEADLEVNEAAIVVDEDVAEAP